MTFRDSCTDQTAVMLDYNAHVLDSILKYVAPELGWR